MVIAMLGFWALIRCTRAGLIGITTGGVVSRGTWFVVLVVVGDRVSGWRMVLVDMAVKGPGVRLRAILPKLALGALVGWPRASLLVLAIRWSPTSCCKP